MGYLTLYIDRFTNEISESVKTLLGVSKLFWPKKFGVKSRSLSLKDRHNWNLIFLSVESPYFSLFTVPNLSRTSSISRNWFWEWVMTLQVTGYMKSLDYPIPSIFSLSLLFLFCIETTHMHRPLPFSSLTLLVSSEWRY